MDKIKTVILSSAKLNDIKILEDKYKNIKSFLDLNLPEYATITIGVIKNVNLITFLKENGYEITRKNQRVMSLENSNKKLIRENDLVIFLKYQNSQKIDDFIDYAHSIDNKKIAILDMK